MLLYDLRSWRSVLLVLHLLVICAAVDLQRLESRKLLDLDTTHRVETGLQLHRRGDAVPPGSDEGSSRGAGGRRPPIRAGSGYTGPGSGGPGDPDAWLWAYEHRSPGTCPWAHSWKGRFCMDPATSPKGSWRDECHRMQYRRGTQQKVLNVIDKRGTCPLAHTCMPFVNDRFDPYYPRPRVACVPDDVLGRRRGKEVAGPEQEIQLFDFMGVGQGRVVQLPIERMRRTIAQLQAKQVATFEYDMLAHLRYQSEATRLSLSATIERPQDEGQGSTSGGASSSRDPAADDRGKRKAVAPAEGDFEISLRRMKGSAGEQDDWLKLCTASTSDAICEPEDVVEVRPDDQIHVHLNLDLELSLGSVVKLFTFLPDDPKG